MQFPNIALSHLARAIFFAQWVALIKIPTAPQARSQVADLDAGGAHHEKIPTRPAFPSLRGSSGTIEIPTGTDQYSRFRPYGQVKLGAGQPVVGVSITQLEFLLRIGRRGYFLQDRVEATVRKPRMFLGTPTDESR
jgi:hypothetical protein